MNHVTSLARHHRAGMFLMLALTAVCAGCLVSHSSDQHITGNYVPQSAFDRIEPGKTTAAWVKATLGEPSTKQPGDGSAEVWKYSYTEEQESSGAIFLIFGGSDKKALQRTAYVEFKDGVVSSKWRG